MTSERSLTFQSGDKFGLDGHILLYGVGIESLTAIHYIERLSGGPVYRYDKIFSGSVVNNDQSSNVNIVYHVRPLGHALTYDFQRLAFDLQDEGILRPFRSGPSQALLISVPELCSYWTDKISGDPLYLLDEKTRSWVAPKLASIGRPFIINDFEKTE